jgi:GTP-binding protein HflX
MDRAIDSSNTSGPPDSSKLIPERAFLFGLQLTRDGRNLWTVDDSLQELAQLARTAGLSVTGMNRQRLFHPNPLSYMGKGKLEEVRNRMIDLDTRALVLDEELTPGQQRNIEESLPEGFKVVDRTALILDIFAQHASSREGKLQVELAQCQYRLPRLTRLWTHLVRQSGARAGGVKGGVGLRGPGETQIETDRRLMRKKISVLKRELEEVRSHRKHRRQKRKRRGMPVTTLVGYTNAGKSSLLNALSQADVLVEDQLFATLDPTTRRVPLPSGREVLFTDTVGFINKLPHDLVAAFRATLEEITESDLILHVVDITHPKAPAQIEAVERVLTDLGVTKETVVTVWNKIDRLPDDEIEQNHALQISALTGRGIPGLLERVEQILNGSMKLVELLLPYTEGRLLGEIYRQGSVEREEHRGTGTFLRVHLPALLAGQLAKYSRQPA